MDYEKVLNDLVSGALDEFRVQPENAFAFQAALREFGKKKEIIGNAQRNGDVVYIGSHNQ